MTKGLYFPNVRLYYPYRQYTNRVLISSYLYLYRMSGINRNYIIRDLILGYVHTNPFSYASVFDPTKTDTNTCIRVHMYRYKYMYRSPWETDHRVHDVSVFARPH